MHSQDFTFQCAESSICFCLISYSWWLPSTLIYPDLCRASLPQRELMASPSLPVIIYWKCKMRIWLQECVGKAKEYMSRQQHCVCLSVSVYLLSALARAPQYDARKEQKISSPFKWLVHSYAWNWEIGKEEFKILVIGTDVFWGARMQPFRCPLNSPLELLTAF